MKLKDGRIAVSWNGTTDTVSIYDPTLNNLLASYSDTAILPNPWGISQRENGNLLVIDATYHYLVELSLDGEFINIIGAGLLNGPRQVFVVPDF